MDIGLFRGLVTVVLFVAFCGVVVWAYSRRREADFGEASRLPLEDHPPGPHTPEGGKRDE